MMRCLDHTNTLTAVSTSGSGTRTVREMESVSSRLLTVPFTLASLNLDCAPAWECSSSLTVLGELSVNSIFFHL